MSTRRSVSQLTSFAQCPEAYRLERVAKAPQQPAAWFVMGTAAHHAIENYENFGRIWTPDEMTDVFLEEYDTGIKKLQEKWPEEHSWMTGGRKKGWNDIADRREIGAWQVRDYIRYALEGQDQWRIMPMPGGGIATELEFTIWLNGVEVYGFIDAVKQFADGSIRPDDWKTGTTTPGTPIQLATYALVLEEQTGIRPTHGAFVKLGRPATPKKAEQPTKDVVHELTGFDRKLIEQEFATMDKIESMGLYLANPQDGCERTCGVAAYCRMKGNPELAAQFATITTRPQSSAPQLAPAAPAPVVAAAPPGPPIASSPLQNHPDPWDPAAPAWEEGDPPF